MTYKLYAGLAKTSSEYLSVKSAWIPIIRSQIDSVLWAAMRINDHGAVIAWEIEGDDGIHLSRQEIESLIDRDRQRLVDNPPREY